jgi:hypothetical protein
MYARKKAGTLLLDGPMLASTYIATPKWSVTASIHSGLKIAIIIALRAPQSLTSSNGLY